MKLYTVGLNQARVDSLKTLLHKQTKTTVSNKNKYITKFQLTIDENSFPRSAKLQSEIGATT